MPFATKLIPPKASSIKSSFRVQEIDKWIKPLWLNSSFLLALVYQPGMWEGNELDQIYAPDPRSEEPGSEHTQDGFPT